MASYTFVRTDSYVSPIYRVLVPPEDRLLFPEKEEPIPKSCEKKIGFIAKIGDSTVGILVVHLNNALKTASFHTLYVHPSHRNRKIASKLLSMAVEEMQKEEVIVSTLLYEKESPYTPYVQSMLKAGEWKGPRILMIRCYFDPYTFNAPWMHRHYRYPPGYEEFFWKDLTPEEKIKLKNAESDQLYPSELSPFYQEEKIEFMNSLGLRFDGNVVGWMITHRVDPDTIRYSSFFILREFQNRGIAIKLLADSLLIHEKSLTKYAELEVPYVIVSSQWIHLIEKRLIPYSKRVSHLLQAWI
ncbi:MAG: GNAT family N-acetyltransferase [Parachlamydiaceae bacterium]